MTAPHVEQGDEPLVSGAAGSVPNALPKVPCPEDGAGHAVAVVRVPALPSVRRSVGDSGAAAISADQQEQQHFAAVTGRTPSAGSVMPRSPAHQLLRLCCACTVRFDRDIDAE